MNTLEKQIIRSIRRLAQTECANHVNGSCLPEDCPCHVINPAYKAIHDGAVDCDYCLFAVLPQHPELNTAIWHEIFRGEGQAGEGWKECVRCHKPFIPASNRQRYCTLCGAAAKRDRSIDKQRRYRARKREPCSVTLWNEKSPEKSRLLDT